MLQIRPKELLYESGLTDRLMRLADEVVGDIRGSLAYANMIGSFLFAGISSIFLIFATAISFNWVLSAYMPPAASVM